MVVSTGWLGISVSDQRWHRDMAIIFGLGAGLIGDEVGLLLTFGDYTSNITEIFFVSAIAFIILVTLVSRGREHIEKEVINISRRERLTQVGVFIGAFSVIFFAMEDWGIGLAFLGLGLLLFLWGFERERRPRSLRFLAS
jgi:O-antigen/teichoic acid export membrane protein